MAVAQPPNSLAILFLKMVPSVFLSDVWEFVDRDRLVTRELIVIAPDVKHCITIGFARTSLRARATMDSSE